MEYYPSWRYYRTEKPRLVRNTAEDQALGRGWEDTPAKFKDEAPPPEETPEEAEVVEEPEKRKDKKRR